MDILSIYALFLAIASTAAIGFWHALLGRPHTLTRGLDCAGIATAFAHILTLALLAWCVALWREIDQAPFLFATGGTIICCNAATRALLAFRVSASRGHALASACASALWQALRSACPRLVVLSCAAYVNLAGRVAMAAVRQACDLASSPALVAANIELVRRRDWAHGAWHYLSSSALLAMALNSLEGLDGPPTEERGGRRLLGANTRRLSRPEELSAACLEPGSMRTPALSRRARGDAREDLSAVMSMAYALSVAALFAADVTSQAWMRFFVITSLCALPARAVLRALLLDAGWPRLPAWCAQLAASARGARIAGGEWPAGAGVMPMCGDRSQPVIGVAQQAGMELPPTSLSATARGSLGELRINMTPASPRTPKSHLLRGHRRCQSLPVARAHLANLRDILNLNDDAAYKTALECVHDDLDC